MFINILFNALDLVGGDRLMMREVEAQAVFRNIRALLLHVASEDAAQRGLQQVRRRVVAHDRQAALEIDLGGNLVVHFKTTLLDGSRMDKDVIDSLGV